MNVQSETETSCVLWRMSAMEFLRLLELLELDVANYQVEPEVIALATEGRAYLDAQA